METLTAIKERRSVKHYDKEYEIPKNEVKQLLESALLSPTSYNLQHWRIVQITDPSLKEQIREAAWGQAQVTDASLLFLLCANIKAWNESPEQYWTETPQEVIDMIVPTIDPFYNGKEQLQRDEAMRSVGILAQTMMLAAKSMDYDSSPMIGFDSEKIAELINLPENHVIGMMLAIGKGIKPANPRGGQLPLDKILIKNKF